jgi:arylsulfatase A-like enzyme
MLPPYYLFPIMMFFLFAFVHVSRLTFVTPSRLKLLGHASDLLFLLILQTCELGYIGAVHFWLHHLCNVRLRLPSLPLNLAILAWLWLNFLASVYDLENTRYNLQTLLFSTIRTYAMRMVRWKLASPLYLVPTMVGPAKTANHIYDAIYDDFPFWISLGVVVLICLFVSIAFLYVNKDAVIASAYRPLPHDLVETAIDDEMQQGLIPPRHGCRRLADSPWPDRRPCATPPSLFQSSLFIVVHILMVFHLLAVALFLFFPANRRLPWFSVRPVSYNLMVCMTHYERWMPRWKRELFPKTARTFLPAGRFWLDGRDRPAFPAVHGDLPAFCAYNRDAQNCRGFAPTPSPTPVPNPPNIVLLIYESMNPATYLIDGEFLDEQARSTIEGPDFLVSETAFYDRKVVPALRALAKEGITFSGLSAHGLPTFSAFHSLLTGVVPSQTYMNTVDGAPAHTDEIPSFLRAEGYRTMCVTAGPLVWDSLDNWAFRRSAVEEALITMRCEEGYGDLLGDPIQDALTPRPAMVDCSQREAEVKRMARRFAGSDFPKWFDYIASYFPNERQARVLNVSIENLAFHDWSPDRVTTRQFQLHWRQQRALLDRTNQSNKPIFGILLDVDAHTPYRGWDSEQFYEPIDKSISPWGEEHKRARYRRVNQYVDSYFVKETIDFLRREAPNTIVVLTGDHGTRDMPIRRKNSHVTNRTVFSGDCVDGTSGVDSLFVVSGVISYLGDDPAVKAALQLDKLGGKTIKIPCDHNDLMYTLMDVTSQLNGHSVPPTSRRARSLFNLSSTLIDDIAKGGNKAALEKIDATKWQSLSVLSHQLEYRNGSQMFRTHPIDLEGGHYYSHASYPTCLKGEGAPEMKLGLGNATWMGESMFNYLDSENHMFAMNELFHYRFRDRLCIEKQDCALPQRNRPVMFNDASFYLSVVGVPALAGVAGFWIVGLFYVHDWTYERKKRRYSEDMELALEL